MPIRGFQHRMFLIPFSVPQKNYPYGIRHGCSQGASLRHTANPAIRWTVKLRRLHYNFKSRRGVFGGFFPGRLFFAISIVPDLRGEFEIGMEFMPAVWAAHEHSPDICGDTKRLMTSFAVFENVIFHKYCIGRGVVTIKQSVATI